MELLDSMLTKLIKRYKVTANYTESKLFSVSLLSKTTENVAVSIVIRKSFIIRLLFIGTLLFHQIINYYLICHKKTSRVFTFHTT